MKLNKNQAGEELLLVVRRYNEVRVREITLKLLFWGLKKIKYLYNRSLLL